MERRLSSITTPKKEYAFLVFLLVSAGLHAGSLLLANYFDREEPADPPADIEISIEGQPDQPPPLGTNDTETGPPISEEPTPPPVPEDTPPPPEMPSDFDVPDEKPTPAPAATPKAVPKNTPKPGPASTPSYNPNARPGAIKGVDAAHGGVAGGVGAVKGGGKADFTSTPNMQIPYTLQQRLRGVSLKSARAIITYKDGKIVDVEVTQSSGNSALDAQVKRHVFSNYRLKAGTSGSATLPVGFKL